MNAQGFVSRLGLEQTLFNASSHDLVARLLGLQESGSFTKGCYHRRPLLSSVMNRYLEGNLYGWPAAETFVFVGDAEVVGVL